MRIRSYGETNKNKSSLKKRMVKIEIGEYERKEARILEKKKHNEKECEWEKLTKFPI